VVRRCHSYTATFLPVTALHAVPHLLEELRPCACFRGLWVRLHIMATFPSVKIHSDERFWLLLPGEVNCGVPIGSLVVIFLVACFVEIGVVHIKPRTAAVACEMKNWIFLKLVAVFKRGDDFHKGNFYCMPLKSKPLFPLMSRLLFLAWIK